MSESDPIKQLREEINDMSKTYGVRPDEMVDLLILRNLIILRDCVHEHLDAIQYQGEKNVSRQHTHKTK